MASENHGLPPEVHIDHWNEATNIYMVVIVVSIWLFVYLKKHKGIFARFFARPTAEMEERTQRYREELKQVRLRQQLNMYYISRKWEQNRQNPEAMEHHVDMDMFGTS
ncbi:small integral membrane protein 19-like [Patiria miniata]|uniref:Small integral membrane protein 19 n=1 Tax=Patiria miniata TaxID=46514 RepID=A0A914B479_PATMI|nr:small integral membrane protein 19-like [Patiria miniata]